MKLDKNKKTIEAYDKNAAFYAEKFYTYAVRKDDIDRAFNFNKSGSLAVLELGCGNGKEAKYIVSQVGIENYNGLDASAGLIDFAKKKVPRVMFQVKDLREVEFSDNQFGIIFSFATVLHMKHEDLAVLLQKAGKWLKIGGILYISSKYGDYKEMEIVNLGDTKYYYSYKPEDLVGMLGNYFEVVYKTIHDSEYGPSFTLALRKT
ncbi:MAG: class I SAM-dependent methyltransferase [Candidatus Paceibacterota bacterium]